MKVSFNPHFIFPGLGLALSLPLAFVPNNAAFTTGAMGAAGSMSYLAAQTVMMHDNRKQREELTRQTRQLATRETELLNRQAGYKKDVQAQLDAAIADRDRAIAQVKTQLDSIERQRSQLVNEVKAALGEELTAKFEREYQAKFKDATADYTRREDEFYHAEGELCDQIEALQTVLAQNEAYLKGEFGKAFEARAGQFNVNYKRLQSELDQYSQFVKEAGDEASAEIQKKDLAIAKLKGQVELLSAPRKYRGSSQDDATANKVLEFFLKRSVGVEAEDWDRKMNQLSVWLFPKDAALPQLQMLMDDLQIELGLYARPTVAIDRSCFKITCDTDAKTAAKATINEPPLSRLEKAVSDAIHVRIAAPSGSGKSVLLGNLVNYLTQTYLSTYDLYDPKVTAREVWGNLTPTHYSTDCIPAFFQLAERCLERIDLCKVAAQNNTPAPVFNPEFHIIDELEFMYGLVDIMGGSQYTPKHFAKNAKIGLKVGREHQIKCLFVTQSALCSDVNLKKNDFFNCTSLFLGQTINEALDSDLLSAIPASKKAAIRAEYKARLARGDKYTIMVYEPENPTTAWLCVAPTPGHYAALSGELPSENDISENPVFEGVAQRPKTEGEQGQSIDMPDCATSAQTEGVRADEGTGAASAQELAQLLAQGTHCPDCSHHTASYKRKKPTSTGKVSVKCLNKECSTKTFSWKVI